LEAMYDVANDFIAIGREVALKAVRLYLDGNNLVEIAKQVRADEEDVKSMLVEAGVLKE